MKIIIGIISIILLVVVLRLGEIYTQLARYQKYWSKVNQTPINPNDIAYIAFGDSAAQGVGATSPDKGYVGLIAESLYEQKHQNVHVINLSKSGAKIKDVLDVQLPKYEQLNIPNQKIFTIEIGANDIITFDQNEFEKEMDELMQTLPKSTVISDLPSFSGSRLSRFENRVVVANGIIHRLAASHGLKLAELNRNVSKNHSLRTFGADLFHPSNYGYRTNWAPAFLDQISLN